MVDRIWAWLDDPFLPADGDKTGGTTHEFRQRNNFVSSVIGALLGAVFGGDMNPPLVSALDGPEASHIPVVDKD